MGVVLPVAVMAALIGMFALARGVIWGKKRRDLGRPEDRATFQTLHTASLAAPPLRAGLTEQGAQKAARHLRALLGSSAVAITDGSKVLAWDGAGGRHCDSAVAHASGPMGSGRTEVLGPETVACAHMDCPIRYAIVVPLTADGRVVGTLASYGDGSSAYLIRAVEEVGHWVGAQLVLAELDQSRTRLAEAEVRALRAQISPHFIYNSLTTIASFVRTDPERARELLLEFADFTRYSFRRHGDFTTLAEELRSVDRYLLLQRARFGDQLQVTLRIAPEVLPIALPFLCLQPLVENAVRHGLQDRSEPGRITLIAEDAGAECVISVEDDGVGMDPDRLGRLLAGEEAEPPEDAGIGLANIDLRMRQVFGDAYGLAVETAPGAGTKVTLRVPKYHPGVSAP
jgi:two-component system LytT family sensor kinase